MNFNNMICSEYLQEILNNFSLKIQFSFKNVLVFFVLVFFQIHPKTQKSVYKHYYW